MTIEKPAKMPNLRRWLLPAFVASLMLNLLVAGLVLGHRFGGDRERMAGASFVQLVPREFFRNLPQERRRQLLRGVLDGSKSMRDIRDGTSQLVLKFADALDASSFDQQVLEKSVMDFATGEESMAGQGSRLIIDLVAKLTPEERKALAIAVRERAAHMKDRKQR